MSRWNLLALIVGASLIIGLIVHTGVDEVVGIIRVVGFGILLVAAVHGVTLTLETLAWRSLIVQHGERPKFLPLLWMRWIGYGANALLPVAHIGGEVVRVRLLAQQGISRAVAGASVLLDATVTLASLVLFTGVGLGVILVRGAERAIWLPVVIVGGLLALMLVGFVFAQLSGLLRRLSKRGGHEETLEDVVRASYRHPGGFLRATGWRFLGWFTGALELLVAMWLLGNPARFFDAVVLESAGAAVRNAAFIVPAGLGVQEAGIVLVGEVAGVTAATALGIALVKRVRDLVLGVPALLSWHRAEARSKRALQP